MQWTPWLIRAPSTRHRMRLFCFPYAGGSPFGFTPWRAALNPSIEVCAVQLPGRGARITEPPIASMQELLRSIVPVIAQQNDMPFALFGHSVGALIAFEVARYLRLHGIKSPERLFVSGCQAPQYRSPSRQLHKLPDEEFINELRDYNGTPVEVLENIELMTLMLPTIRADFALAEDFVYKPGPLLQMPISVFAGKEDDNKAPGQVDGWERETAGTCRITWFEDGHFFINSQRDALLEHLDAELSAVLVGFDGTHSRTDDADLRREPSMQLGE